ncbi:MAG TPA: sigma-70 family RNA polymerase sigma factor [Blastocatellia bacterium]|nr:sigma-70 family RNA polymerase sigma factor [Blastocatellia bacterium]
MASSAVSAEEWDPVRWGPLVERIRAGDDTAVQELYLKLCTGLGFLIRRQLGAQDMHDHVHHVFIIVLTAIRSGRLRVPEALIGFAWAVMRNHIAACIDEMQRSRQENPGAVALDSIALDQHSPEDAVLNQEKTEIAYRALKQLRPRDREILTRFYLSGQTEERICEEMQLTSTQFRLAKSRAKAAFGEIGERLMARRPSVKGAGGR